MGAISGLLSRVLHAILIALSIGMIASFSVASNPSGGDGKETGGTRTRVSVFTFSIILAIFSFVWFCLLLVLSFTRLWRHAPLPRVIVTALSVVVDTLIFLQTSTILSNAAIYYYLLKEAEDQQSSSRNKSGGSRSGSSSSSSSFGNGNSSRYRDVESSQPYLAVVVVTALFDFFLLCDITISFVRMLSSAHEIAPVQKYPDGHATSHA
ncbi:hypothetical protein PG989_011020 [Apiospora arundinis]